MSEVGNLLQGLGEPMSNNIESLQPVSREVLEFLIAYHEERGISPTLREIAAGCHISLGAVVYHLSFLEMRDWIERIPSQPRSIRVLHSIRPGDGVPPSEN